VIIKCLSYLEALQSEHTQDEACLWIYEDAPLPDSDYRNLFLGFYPLRYPPNVTAQQIEDVRSFLCSFRYIPILLVCCESGYIRAPALGMAAAQILSDAWAFHHLYKEYQCSYDRNLFNAFAYGPQKPVVHST
jgi:hypothetical protein